MSKVTHEKLQKDREQFYSKYPNHIWEVYEHSAAEQLMFKKVSDFLVNTQNGPDVDDYIIDEGSGIVKRLSGHLSNKDILIVGTGTGREMQFAREEGARKIEGITMGKRNCMFAKEMVGEQPIITDMHFLPWQQNTFDIVAGFQVLEHSYAPVMFLLECNRVLRTGGEIHIETPPANGFSMDTWLHHILCPTPRQLYHLLIKTGFLPVQFNAEKLPSNLLEREKDFDWLDDSNVSVYMKAIKQDPETYPRGDIRRYYETLKTGKFRP